MTQDKTSTTAFADAASTRPKAPDTYEFRSALETAARDIGSKVPGENLKALMGKYGSGLL